jgi:hypothetical protein
MNTIFANVFKALCSWLPGSRATPAPRNDEVLNFLTPPKAGIYGTIGTGRSLSSGRANPGGRWDKVVENRH